MQVRGHVYSFGCDLRCLPTCQLEEMFQYLSCIAHGAAIDNVTCLMKLHLCVWPGLIRYTPQGLRMRAFDCLGTFTRVLARGSQCKSWK